MDSIPKAITHVTIRGAHRILEDRHTVRDPMTVMGGQYSLPFTAAVALTRDMSNPLVYNDEAVKDPLVRSLAKNMELIVDEAVHDLFPAEVTIVCGDKTYKKTTSAHKGSPHNPLTWADACEKFSRYTRTLDRRAAGAERSWMPWAISRTRATWRALPPCWRKAVTSVIRDR